MKKLTAICCLIATLVTIFGSYYVITHQSLRQSANDPQIQIAQDIASQLKAGQPPRNLTTTSVDIAKSLAPFVTIYNKTGQSVASTGYLNGAIPEIPIGVLEHAKQKPYNAVTWSPQPQLRIAAVALEADNYFVVSGRSLKEVDDRIDRSFMLSLAGLCISSTFGLLGLFLLRHPVRTNKKPSK